MLSPTYEITTALSHTDELISPPYDIAIVTISYGRVIMSSVWDSMMSKKNVGWPFYAAVIIWYLFQTRNWLAHNTICKRVLSTIWRLSGEWRPLHRLLIKYSIPVLQLTLPESFPAFRTNARCIQLQFSVLFYFKLPSHSLSAPYAPWQWHITL